MTIVVIPYDHEWPGLFDEVKAELQPFCQT